MTEYEKMMAGLVRLPAKQELAEMRKRAREIVPHETNQPER